MQLAALALLLERAPSTSIDFAPVLRADCVNTWHLVAERGVFAFDSDPNGGPYRLVAAPTRPARLDGVPDAIRAVVSRVRLARLRFDCVNDVPDALLRPDAVSHRAALHALQLVLVLARKMAYDGDAHRDIADVLDVAEHLPALLAARHDRSADLRAQLAGLAARWPAFALALASLDEPSSTWHDGGDAPR